MAAESPPPLLQAPSPGSRGASPVSFRSSPGKRKHGHSKSKGKRTGGKKQEQLVATEGVVNAPFHTDLERALSDDAALRPVHFKVVNESYWYHQRKRLHPKYHMDPHVMYNELRSRWEAQIYQLRPRESDGEYRPTLVMVSAHSTKLAAFKACQGAMRGRDQNPGAQKKLKTIKPSQIRSSHFKVLVVSEAFKRLSSLQRTYLVLERLLLYGGDMQVAGPMHGSMVPSRVRGVSTFGPRVCNLPCFRAFDTLRYTSADNFVDETGIVLLVDAKTPSQWNSVAFPPPDTERYGPQHGGDTRSLGVDPVVTTKRQKHRLNLLTQSQSQSPTRFGSPSRPTSRAQNSPARPRSRASSASSENPQGPPEDTMVGEWLGVGGLEHTNMVAGVRYGSSHMNNHGSSSQSCSPSKPPLPPRAGGTKTATPASIARTRTATETSTNMEGAAYSGTSDTVETAVTQEGDTMEFVPEGEQTVDVDAMGNTVDDSADPFAGVPSFGGVYSHFFNDLPDNVRSMLMARMADNDALVGRLQSRPGSRASKAGDRDDTGTRDEAVPQTTLSKMRQRQEQRKAYDKSGTQSEKEMMEAMSYRTKTLENAAIRLQRAYRIRNFHRALRLFYRRQFAALNIQRVVRGNIARIYARLYGELRGMAAMRIQAAYRSYTARKAIAVWRETVFHAIRVIRPYIRRFLKNCYQKWMRRHSGAAVHIQRVCRSYLARMEFYRRAGRPIVDVYPEPAVRLIQRVYRGYRGRLRIEELWEERMVEKIDIPSAVLMQRCYRGHRARVLCEKKRLERKHAIVIQTYARGYLMRQWYALHLWHKRRHRAANLIQRVYRGHLERVLYQFRLDKYHFLNVVIPAVIKMQAAYRGYRVRVEILQTKKEHAAATSLQQFWRRLKERLAALEKWHDLMRAYRDQCATKVQVMIRMRLARKELRYRARLQAAKCVLAGRTILRVWLRFRDARIFRRALVQYRALRSKRLIDAYEKDRDGVKSDLNDIRIDLKDSEYELGVSKRRAYDIQKFIHDARMRLGIIDDEMDRMQPEDVERGWEEAYIAEFGKIEAQIRFAREELHLHLCVIARCKREIEHLHFELEEVELDLGHIETRQQQEYEVLRRIEVSEARRRADIRKSEAVRRQKARWGIADIRTKVIRENNEQLQEMKASVIAKREIDYARTINFHTRRDMRIEEQREVRHLERRADRERVERSRTVHIAREKVQDTYDSVVANTLSLLRSATQEARLPKSDARERPRLSLARKNTKKKKYASLS